MKQQISEKIKLFLIQQKIESNVEVLKTKDIQFGDYTSNVALKLTKELQKPPIEIAQQIKNFLESNFSEEFEKITITTPGFINFFLSKKILTELTLKYANISYKPEFKSIIKQKYNYEFISANPTGYLHIGHLRNAIVGDITASLLQYVGNAVTREYWINDYGNQIIVMAESVLFYLAPQVGISINLEKEKVGYHGKEITSYANYLAENEIEKFAGISQEEAIELLREMGIKYFMQKIKDVLKAIKVKDMYYWTSEMEMFTSGKVKETMNRLKDVNALYEKNGATWLKTQKCGDDKDRVLIKKDGTYTYMVGDVANHIQKFERGFEQLINLWGADHHGYEMRILASMDLLGFDSNRVKMDFINMVQIEDNGAKVKMSKRAGTSLTIVDMLELLDANLLRYFIISKSKEQEIVLNISKVKEESTNNPFYYAQYANARAMQIIEHFKKTHGKPEKINVELVFGEIPKERELLTKIIEFEDAILNAVEKKEPYMVLIYQRELAQVFNSFYNEVKIVTKDKKYSNEKLQLIFVIKKVFERLFKLLGIEPINKI